MADRKRRGRQILQYFIIFASIVLCVSQQPSSPAPGGGATCTIPAHIRGDYFSMESGSDISTLINAQSLSYNDFTGVCSNRSDVNGTEDANGSFDTYLLLRDTTSNCYRCYYMVPRTPNVLQYKQTNCITSESQIPTLQSVCSHIEPLADFYTFFRLTLVRVNCMQTFYGVYQFSYEINDGGGGICNNSNSQIVACQEPGSPYVDNEVFTMSFARCPEVTASVNRNVRFQCMGSWQDDTGNVWSAIADTGAEVYRSRFRCLLTRLDQQLGNSESYYTMSWWSECNSLKSPYEGPLRLKLVPALTYAQRQLLQPTCQFPQNLTGSWYHVAELESQVDINTTHIRMTTKLDQFKVKWSDFVCMMTSGTRFLTIAVTTGRCEIDYVCWDIMPRHQSIVRWRMGRPYRPTSAETILPDVEAYLFRKVCSWNSFTIDRANVDWAYKTFLLSPPQASQCPIRGRFHFTQGGEEGEKYRRRYRGVTERPRHQINCKDFKSVLYSCVSNPERLFIDSNYCETVDHTGRPIGEYDEPDWQLACIGHWTESWTNYLITWNPEDSTSPYRCWIYEYTDWRHVHMSRSTNAVCSRLMTATSSLPTEGASLALDLTESERLFDDCPMYFSQGGYESRSKLMNPPSSAALPITHPSVMSALLLATHRLVLLYFN